MTSEFIPVSMPDLGGNEEKYVLEALRSTWISSTGAFVDRFERDFSHLCAVDHTIPVSNGTVALHLTMLVLGIGPEDEVIVPSLSYVATANAVKYVGATPVFVDVDPQTWCLDPNRLEEAITPRTRAIIVVHLYGHPADMDSINRIALPYGIPVIEDAAEALLARYKGAVVGGLAKLAVFSFYGNKVITSGEGGAVTTNDPELAYRVRILRGQGMDPDRRYFFPVTGYNYRLTNLACAILCAQIERVENLVKRRREIFDAYNELLAGIPGIGFQPVAPWAEISPWLYCITVDAEHYRHKREDLAGYLAQNGVETRPFFIPLHTLPPFRSSSKSNIQLPVTDRLAIQGINLPTFPAIGNRQIEKITGLIRSLVEV
jgi:perosamine synthetase